ncbi:MAG: preprotein translocase subunit YajC [candidate division WOR-3 bacterium]
MIETALAQTGGQASSSQTQTGGLGLLGSLLPLILIVAVLYFLMILPQQRRQKKHQQMLQALKRGDRVVLSGGIFGTISEVKDGTLMVKVAENTVIEVEKGAVTYRFGTPN